MAERPLSADEALLWTRLLATVRPMPGKPVAKPVTPVAAKLPKPAKQARPTRGMTPTTPAPLPPSPAKKRGHDTATLDGTWDRQLSKGQVYPDALVDLHGDTLDRAYARIDFALEQAVARGDRVLLLVTGKPGIRGGRGSIRAVVGDWLAASRHASAIAAVRPAHPRHGGSGALYLVLRRR